MSSIQCCELLRANKRLMPALAAFLRWQLQTGGRIVDEVPIFHRRARRSRILEFSQRNPHRQQGADTHPAPAGTSYVFGPSFGIPSGASTSSKACRISRRGRAAVNAIFVKVSAIRSRVTLSDSAGAPADLWSSRARRHRSSGPRHYRRPVRFSGWRRVAS